MEGWRQEGRGDLPITEAGRPGSLAWLLTGCSEGAPTLTLGLGRLESTEAGATGETVELGGQTNSGALPGP